MSFWNRAISLNMMMVSLLIVSTFTVMVAGIDNGGSNAIIQAQTRATDAGSWQMYKGDLARTGYSPTILPMGSDTPPLWQVTIPSMKQHNAPVIHEGTAYVGSGDGWLRGFDIDTGDQIWEVKASNKHISTSPVIVNGVIYTGADDGHVYGFDLATRARTFEVNLNTSAIFASPAIANGMLFIGTIGRNLMNSRFYGVDMTTQNISWSYSMGSDLNIYGFSGSAAYDQGRVYVGDGRSTIFCFDSDGFSDGNDGIDTEPDTTIGSADIIWTFNSTSSIVGSPLLAEGMLFFGNDIGNFFALDADDGSLVWTRRMGAGEPPSIQTSPSYHNGTLYVAAQRVWGPFNENKGGSVHAVNPTTGSQIWRYNTTGQMLKSSPVVTDDALVFGAGAGNTSIFCLSTTEENIADEDRVLWYYNSRAPQWTAAALAEGRVFACRPDSQGGTGKLFAFGSPDPEVIGLELSDPSPYVGEMVEISAVIRNEATVDVEFDIQFKASTFNNQDQVQVGLMKDVPVAAFSSVEVSVEWIVEMGYDMMVAFIVGSTPEDDDKTNNFRTVDLSYNQLLRDGWLSAGSGPGKEGSSGGRLDSNRTYWSKDLIGEWQGPPEDPFYEGFGGNGTISAAGGHLYFVSPDGSLMAMNSTPGIDGSPGPLWTYRNSSVDLIGRPILMVDRSMALGGSNKVFSFGDDGALWAFDWAGFWDQRNDGPFISEEDTSTLAGDVVWRTMIPGYPAQSIFISGGNIIVPLLDGNLVAVDDDNGEIVWSTSLTSPQGPYAADIGSIFTFQDQTLDNIDPYDGSISESYDLTNLLGTEEPSSIAYFEGTLLISYDDKVALLDAYPDDDRDGDVDQDDEDLGVPDNSSGYDLIWSTSVNVSITSAPTISAEASSIAVTSEIGVFFLFLDNGTISGHLPVEVSGRPISAGDAFYMYDGSDPWILREFIPDGTDSYIHSWSFDLPSEPRGEGAVMGDNIFVSMRDGSIKAIGAKNSPPKAIISHPVDGVLIFPGETIHLDATDSFDPEGDPLTYGWYLQGEETPVYLGQEPIVNIEIEGTGRTKLVLRVFDDMKAYGEDSINITLLKRITSPDHVDYINDIYVHMSFGISEQSGAYVINSTSMPSDPELPGAVFIANLDFSPLPKYAQYRFEWANISMGFQGKEFQIGMHREKLRLYHFDKDLQQWVIAPMTGVDLEDGLVWGNFSSLESGSYAIGILDNSVPEFRHIPEIHAFRETNGRYKFRVEYRDQDDDVPRYVKLWVDNQIEIFLEVEGIPGSVTRFTYYSVGSVALSAQKHTYYFEADDSHFIVSSPSYSIVVENNPPVAEIVWQTGLIYVRNTIQFSAEGSYDPDGDDLTYAWDFDHDGVTFERDALGKSVGHEFYSPGIYNVTLQISDGKDETYKTIIVTVQDTSPEEVNTPWWILALVSVIAVLIIAVVAFIVLSKKGHEEQDEFKRLAEETWDCPECNRTISRAVDECPACGYEYDPYDFEDDMDEM